MNKYEAREGVVVRIAIPTWSTVGNRTGFLLHRLRDTLGASGVQAGYHHMGGIGESGLM